jgi:hypothetical protein
MPTHKETHHRAADPGDIEAAAEAMWEAEGGDTILTWERLSHRAKQQWRRRAKAALTAHRAP